MKQINLICIGLGLHARNVYLPFLSKYKDYFNINICLGIDLKSEEKAVRNYLVSIGMDIELLFIDPFSTQEGTLPEDLDSYLTHFVNKFQIEAVLISTEPLVHKAYAMWALRNGLHILMDKPVSTRENVVFDMQQAVGIEEDYQDLLAAYRDLQKKKSTIFSINAQRRYHICHQKVLSLIKEVSERFDAPITSIQTSHADGQWRLPNELLEPLTHPFCQGYGKCSHSGYHFFDIVYQYYLAGQRPDKQPDKIQLMSSFVSPKAFIRQFNRSNYQQYFTEEYGSICPFEDPELISRMDRYGELEASVLLRFIKEKENIANATINLTHNSFSRRAWLEARREDLYKKNGRVKHEFHSIQQGPFQNIQIHSYQSKDDHSVNTDDDYKLGGNNHFEIYVFRNSSMFGNDEPTLKTYQIKDIDTKNHYSETELAIDLSKGLVMVEFFDFIHQKIPKNLLISNIESHEIPVKIMSHIYKSHILQQEGQSPLVEFSLLREPVLIPDVGRFLSPFDSVLKS